MSVHRVNGWVTAYIALGSNLGERQLHLRRAVELLSRRESVRLTGQSGLYETAPVGDTEQGWFLNEVISVETSLPPEDLLMICLEIETLLGRMRDLSRRYGPRIIDLDMLAYGDTVLSTPMLTLPHPHLHERAFVLVPLTEIAPDWWHPTKNRTARQLLEGLPAPDQTQTVRKYPSASSAPS